MYHGSQVSACNQMLGTVLILVTLTITDLFKSVALLICNFCCCHSQVVVIALRLGGIISFDSLLRSQLVLHHSCETL